MASILSYLEDLELLMEETKEKLDEILENQKDFREILDNLNTWTKNYDERITPLIKETHKIITTITSLYPKINIALESPIPDFYLVKPNWRIYPH